MLAAVVNDSNNKAVSCNKLLFLCSTSQTEVVQRVSEHVGKNTDDKQYKKKTDIQLVLCMYMFSVQMFTLLNVI